MNVMIKFKINMKYQKNIFFKDIHVGSCGGKENGTSWKFMNFAIYKEPINV